MWQQRRSTDGFEPGQDAVSAQLQFPERLYGRDAELAMVQGRVEEATAHNRLVTLCIGGAAGVGKSSLIDEFFKTTLEDSGHLIAGKCEALKQHVPYMAIEAALDMWLTLAKSADGQRVAAWSRRLHEALAADADLVAQVVPGIAWLLGPISSTSDHTGEGSQRLQGALVRTLLALAAPHEPLVLFLDDLQWSDLATLQLCEALMRAQAKAPVLLILAYRDQEISLTHPFQRMRDRVAKSDIQSAHLDLTPLAADAITQWLQDVLHQSGAQVQPLAEVTLRKTAGNPFFMREFINRLRADDLLRFDDARCAWGWDAECIASAAISDNLVDLVSARLTRLMPDALDILSTAACIGHRFEPGLVSQVAVVDAARVQDALERAARAHLVVPHGDGSLAFSHDKIAQAAHELCPAQERAEKHARIGAILLRTWRDTGQGSLFDITNHLNRAPLQHPLSPPAVELAEFNLQAAQQARRAAAFAEGQTYYEHAQRLLPAESWESQHATTLAMHLGLAECLFASGEGEAGLLLLQQAMNQARDTREQIAIHRVTICQLYTAGRTAEALQASEVALTAAGIRFDASALGGILQQQRNAVLAHLAGQSSRALLDLPALEDPLAAAVLALISECGPVLAGARPELFALSVAHGMALCLAHGNCPESCFTYSAWGMLLASQEDDYRAACEFGELAVALAERYAHLGWIASARFMLGVQLNHWTHPLSESQAMLESALTAAQHAGNLAYATACVVLSPMFMLESGAPLQQVQVQTETCLTFAHERRLSMWVTFLQLVLRFCRNLQGQAAPGEPTTGVPEAYAEQLREGGHYRVLASLYLLDGFTAMQEGQVAEARSVLLRLQPLARSLALLPQLAQYTFLQGWTAQRSLSAQDRSQDWAAILTRSYERFAIWGRSCPQNYAVRAHTLQAMQHMQSNDDGAALPPLEVAISCADQFNQPLLGSLVAELAGAQARALGLRLACTRYYSEATTMARRAGANDRAERLERLYGLAPEKDRGTADAGIGHLDGVSVAKACQTISSEMELGALLTTLLPVVMECVGAEQGYLMLYDNETLNIEVSARVGEAAALRHIPLSAAEGLLPVSVVTYVDRTQEIVGVDARNFHPVFSRDVYLRGTPHYSLLCAPLARRGTRMGLLYLENRLVDGAFAPERRRVLDLLMGQIAISLDACYLYLASQRAVTARDEFLSVASHELKTPLTSLRLQLQNFTRLVGRGVEIPVERTEKVLHVANTQIERLANLIDELLDMARADAKQLDLRRVPMDLAELARDVVERCAGQLRNAACDVHLGITSAQGQWDRSRLDQVLTNLLHNAIKFGPGKPIDVMVNLQGNQAKISVRDHGIGIAAQDQRRIFNKFERIISKSNIGGLGLGLYVTQQIVTAHGGHIQVQSEVGEGTCFSVILPTEAFTAPASAQ